MNRKADIVKDYFSQIYLTIIALIQGVALVQLVPYLITYFSSNDKIFTDNTPPFLISLMIIFIVWHHYVNGIVFLRWFPNIFDALIPFMVGITEFFIIAFVAPDEEHNVVNIVGWTKAFGCFLFFGSIAYFAAAVRHEADLFTNIMSHHFAEKHKVNIRHFYVPAGISFLVQCLFVVIIIRLHQYNLLWVSALLFLLHIIVSEFLNLKYVKPDFIKGITSMKE